MPKVKIYTKGYCPYCLMAKRLLIQQGLDFEEIEITGNRALQAEVQNRAQRHTVPQIFIDDIHIGGSDDLANAISNGSLDRIISQAMSVA